MVAKLSLADKVNLATGVQWQKGAVTPTVYFRLHSNCPTQVSVSETSPQSPLSLVSVDFVSRTVQLACVMRIKFPYSLREYSTVTLVTRWADYSSSEINVAAT